MNQAGRSDDIRDITEPGWREREAERHERLKNAIPEVSAGGIGIGPVVVTPPPVGKTDNL